MHFAVQIEGESIGRWVLAVDGDRLLVTDAENRLRWVPIAQCKLLKATNPDMPQPVMVVQPQQNPLALPHLKLDGGQRLRE